MPYTLTIAGYPDPDVSFESLTRAENVAESVASEEMCLVTVEDEFGEVTRFDGRVRRIA